MTWWFIEFYDREDELVQLEDRTINKYIAGKHWARQCRSMEGESLEEFKERIGLKCDCRVCGTKLFTTSKTYRPWRIDKHICLGCDIWDELPESAGKIVIDGHMYSIGSESGNKDWRGFGGREFEIRMLDTGTVIRTTNLWSNGEISEYYRDKFPDTAEFVRGEQWVQVGNQRCLG